MAQNVTFDLPNTTIPAGILKMQVTADLTGFDALTGSAISWTGNAFTGTGTLFLTELKVGGKISFYILTTQYTATVLSIPSNTLCTINIRLSSSMAVATPTPAGIGVKQVSTLTPSANIVIGDTFTTTIDGTPYSFVATATTIANITAGLTTVINADGGNVVVAVDQSTYIEVTADDTNTPFTITAGTTEVAGSTTSYPLAAGQTVVIADTKFLMIPTTNLLIVMDEQVEKVDVKMGVYEYDEFTLEFADDYSWYVAGFWYNLFRLTAGSAVTFFVRMEESGVDSFVTYGNVNLTSVEFNELALDEPNITTANSKIRTCKLSIVSGLDLLKNVTIVQLITELMTHTIELNAFGSFGLFGDYPECFRLIDVFNCATQLAFGQSFDDENTVIRNSDIIFEAGVSDNTDYTFNYAWMIATALTANGVLNSSSTVYWGNIYPTAFELIQMLSFSFGYVPRHYFGQEDGTYVGDGSDRHRIELLTRGQSGSLITMEGGVIESVNSTYSPFMINNLVVSKRSDSSDSDYFFNSSLNPLSTQIAEAQGTPPSYINFDLTISTDLRCSTSYSATYNQLQELIGFPVTGLFYPSSHDSIESYGIIKYYNYLTGISTVAGVGGSSTTNYLVIGTARYYFYKFKGQATYTRTYSSVQSTVGGLTSQQNTRCLRRHTITDEFGARTFYAIEVRKSFINNTATLVWFQE